MEELEKAKSLWAGDPRQFVKPESRFIQMVLSGIERKVKPFSKRKARTQMVHRTGKHSGKTE